MTTPLPPTVAVTGTARREIAPDSFAFTAVIEVRATSSDEAHRGLAARAAELDAVAAALPVEAVRGQVSGWRDGRRSAWTASRSVTVTGRDLETTADVAGALGALADVTVRGPHWQVDADNPAHDELQAAAVFEARARAQRYALALGATLGRLVELSDVGGGDRGWYGQSALLAGAAGPGGGPGLETLDLEPRPVALSASVNARWYLDIPE